LSKLFNSKKKANREFKILTESRDSNSEQRKKEQIIQIWRRSVHFASLEIQKAFQFSQTLLNLDIATDIDVNSTNIDKLRFEILKAKRTTDFFKAIIEIYRVVIRIRTSLTAMEEKKKWALMMNLIY